MLVHLPSYSFLHIRLAACWIAGIGATASIISRSNIIYDQEVASAAANSLINVLHLDPNNTSINVTSARKDSLGFWARSNLQIATNNKILNFKITLKSDTFSESKFDILNYIKEPFLVKRHLKQLLGLSTSYNKQNILKSNIAKRWQIVEIVTEDDQSLSKENIKLDDFEYLKIVKKNDVFNKNIQNTSVYTLLSVIAVALILSTVSLVKFTISYRKTKDCIKFVTRIAENFHKRMGCRVKRTEGTIKTNYFDGKVWFSDNTCLKIVVCRANEHSPFVTHVCKYEVNI